MTRPFGILILIALACEPTTAQTVDSTRRYQSMHTDSVKIWSTKHDTVRVASADSASSGVFTLGSCPTSGYKRPVPVSTVTQLNNAIIAALPGDLINVALGTYGGFRAITRNGTAQDSIWLCSSAGAVIGGTGTAPTPINVQLKANYWVVRGLTFRNAFQPFFVQGDHNTVEGNEIETVGQEALHLKTGATHNLVQGNYIHDTGKTTAQYGEGIYVGSDKGKWVNGVPDKTDSNTIVGNFIGPNIGSQMIDMKEGTTGTEVMGNRFDGAGQSMAVTGNEAWVNAYGNGGRMSGNVGMNMNLKSGYKVETLVTGWGMNNSFEGDTLDLTGHVAGGVGVWVGGPKASTVVKCSEEVISAPVSNLSPICQP